MKSKFTHCFRCSTVQAVCLRAFTLIELLVVIATISLLIAIIVPAVNRARNSAKKVYCLSQLKQITLAVYSYTENNDNQIVKAGPILMSMPPDEERLRQFWVIALMPYLGDTTDVMDILDCPPKLWRCPADRDPYPAGYGRSMHSGVTSYALNGYCSEHLKLGPAGGYKINQISRTSECVLIAETSFAAQIYDAEHPTAVAAGVAMDGHHRITSGFYHNDSMNIAFVDGHTSTVKGIKTDKLVWPRLNTADYQSGKYMYWPDLTLPDATAEPAFWGPGY